MSASKSKWGGYIAQILEAEGRPVVLSTAEDRDRFANQLRVMLAQNKHTSRYRWSVRLCVDPAALIVTRIEERADLLHIELCRQERELLELVLRTFGSSNYSDDDLTWERDLDRVNELSEAIVAKRRRTPLSTICQQSSNSE